MPHCQALMIILRWGSKLVSQGQITFVQFFNSFMAVYFSGQGAGQMFSFASSFTKANSAANYFFWLRSLEPTIRETTENENNRPQKNCSSYDFQNVEFSYPLAPHNRVLKGISLNVGAASNGNYQRSVLIERQTDRAWPIRCICWCIWMR